MLTFTLHRTAQAIIILVVVTFLSFLIMNLAPGNALRTFIDPRIPPSDIAAAERALGLNQPLPLQYLRWMSELTQGNLGYSLRTGNAVGTLILSRLGPTITLMGAAFLVMTLLAILLGVISAARPYSFLDYFVTTFAFAGISIPSFFFALSLIYLFAVHLGWLPTSGLQTYQRTLSGWAALLDRAHHLVLPVAVLTFTGAAELVRHVRSAVSEALRQDYIRTARSKGMRDGAVLIRHALRNSWLPIITLLGVALPRFFSGSVVIEVIFAWPGMGRLLVESVFARDYPVAMGINLFAAILVLLGSFVADLLYGVVDPRVRYE